MISRWSRSHCNSTARGRRSIAPHPRWASTTRRESGRPTGRSVSLGRIFVIFLKAGLAFGGGLSILAMLEDELVRRRKVISRDEFLTMYVLGKIVPSGTMTALAVGLGRRLGGGWGTIVALLGLNLPAF